MAIELFENPASLTSNVIRVLAKRIGVDVKYTPVNLAEKEQLKPEFLKVNPFHTVPALVDNGFHLFESRVILTYLLSKYAPDSDLYPKDVQQRATVDAMLHYDNSVLSASYRKRIYAIIQTGKDLTQDVHDKIKDNLQCLDSVLSTRKYVAGEHLTVADISIIHTLCFAEGFEQDLGELTHLQEYIKRVEGDLGEHYAQLKSVFLTYSKARLESKRKS